MWRNCRFVSLNSSRGGPGDNAKVYHVNENDFAEYSNKHISGAVYLDTQRFDDPISMDRRSPMELEAALCELGMERSCDIVLYSCSPWLLAAYRVMAILCYCGYDQVHVLDGGLDSYRGELSSVVHFPVPIAKTMLRIPERPQVFVDLPGARQLGPQDRLFSVRTQAEHNGLTSGYSYIKEAGDIPGALFFPCGEDEGGKHAMHHYRASDGRSRASDDHLRNAFVSAGLEPCHRAIFFCGTGWRASEAWAYACTLGLDAAIFDGGWFAWSQSTPK